MSTWNHRVLAFEEGDEIWFEIREVHYNEHGKPKAYSLSSASISGHSLEDVDWVLEQMRRATDKPVLWADKRFPEEYKPE